MGWADELKRVTGLYADAVTSPRAVIERFMWRGVPCELLKGMYGACGYVYLPDRVWHRLFGLEPWQLPFDVHGGIDHVSSDGRCLGWSASRTLDVWVLEELLNCSMHPADAAHVYLLQARHGLVDHRSALWTLDRARVCTRDLAEQVATLDYVLPWRPAQRAARRRLMETRREGDG